MSQMQLAGHVGRRYYDRKDLAGAGRIGLEVAAIDPELEPSLLRRLRIECLAQFQFFSVSAFFSVRARFARIVDLRGFSAVTSSLFPMLDVLTTASSRGSRRRSYWSVEL